MGQIYNDGWNDAIDKVIERMKDIIIPRLERHKVWSSTYIIDKIAAEEAMKFIDQFRELKG